MSSFQLNYLLAGSVMESTGMFMLLNIDRHLLSIEIKAARIFQSIEHFCNATPKALPGAVIYAGDLTASSVTLSNVSVL